VQKKAKRIFNIKCQRLSDWGNTKAQEKALGVGIFDTIWGNDVV